MGFMLAVCMAIFVDTVWCVPLIENSGARSIVPEEKVAEFATVHQQTQVSRRKRDAVDHVIFPETMEYDLEFRGQQTKLRLKRHEYLTPDIQLLDQNGPIKHDLARKTGLYHDIEHHGSFVIQCEDTTVHCGLRGSVVLDGHKWDIEPETGSDKLHRLVSSTKTGTKIKFGTDSPHIPRIEGSALGVERQHNAGRQKRAIPTQCQIVECLAICDESIWEFYMNKTSLNTTAAEESLYAYYLALYTQADLHFNFINIRRNDTCMRLYLTGVYIQKTTTESWSFPNELAIPGANLAYVEATNSLLRCGAQVDGIKTSLGITSVDLAQCFTRKDIVWNENSGRPQYFSFYRSVGFRETCCNPAFQIYLASVIEGYGDMVEVHIAHEIARSMNVFDDRTAGCLDEDGYIMSSEVTVNQDKLKYKYPWYFSQCSIDQMYTFIASQPSCLETNGFNATQFEIFDNHTLAGKLYNLTEQCQVRFGFGSEFCDPAGQNRTFFDDMCGTGIFCTVVEFGDGSCTGVTRPFDGSPCGTFGSFCQFGECIIRKGLGENCTCHTDCSAGNAICSYPDYMCACADGFYDNDGNTTGGSCLEKVAVGQTCPQPDACLDPNAFCDNLNCTCLPGYYAENGSCFLLKCLGDACTDTYQCKGNDTECSGMPSTCRCPDDRYFNTSTGECDVKKDLGSSCEDGECLPANSVCGSVTGVCECQEGFFDSDGIGTPGGNCTLKLALDDVCTQLDSCADSNAFCSGTCQCLQDFYNNNGTCERRRCFGESCSLTSDCVSGGGLECIGGTCQCTNTSYFDGLTATCTTKKDLGSSCEPGQCLLGDSVCGSASGVCECREGFFDSNGVSTPGGNCTPKLALDVACSQPDSCADPNANCSGTCQCLQDFYNNNGTCERRRCFGESCSATSDCVSGGGLECIGTTCQCTNTSYFDGITATCTAKKDLGSSCEPGQCLPANSVCGSVSGVCECHDGFFDDNGNATSGGNCTLKLALDVACSQPDSCADPNANCSGTCQCLQDFYNNGGTCERRRCFGESCSATSDCVSGGGLECIGGTCQCTNTTYFDGLTATCTAKKDLGSSCEPGQCLPANSVCGSVSGVCECQNGFFDDNGNATSGGNCTLKLALDVACSQPDSCADPNANCSGTCQCLQDFYNNGGTCERRRCFGESCSATSDCVSGGGLECIGGTCQCTNTTYFDGLTATCTAKKDLGSSCEPGQCLPANSVCGSVSGVCECQDGFFDDNGNATSGGNCTLKLALDVACSQPDSCADPNANCSGTCQCLQDFYNNGGTCERRRCFGESCSATSDCVSGGGLECIGGTCQCTNTSYFDGLTATCTAKKDLGSSCEPGQCLPANSVCGSVSGVCECQNGFFDDNGNATSGGNCTLKLALDVACSQPDSCADPNANCSGTCQCLQDFYNNGGTCERKRCFGESCSATSDCVSGGGLECIGGTCQCTNTSYFDGLTATCTAKKDLGSSCEPGQCLPANSVCGSVSGVCECQDGFFDDNGNATSGGNCTLKLALDVACSQRDSCADPNANCSGTCQCLQDFYNNGGICERRRCFGESCSATSDCVSGGGLECIGGTCQCTNTSYFDGLTATCTAKKDLGSSCEPGQCLPANSVCGSVSGVCECQDGFFDDNGNATSGGNCTLKLALDVACSQRDSCADPNANCSGTCQCLQDFYNNGGICERRRCFGESCSATSDCVSGGGLECIGGTCQCTNTSYFDGLTATCTAKKDLGSSCEPGQCLPANSVCGSVSGVCECQDGFFDDNGNATSGGNCTLKLALDVACSQPDSCADPNANCSGTCQCLQDFYNNGGICERRRCFGESCSATSDCVSGGGLECIGGTCQCTNTSYFDGLTATCTAKKDLGSSCEPGQCLPANSVCGSVNGVCECQDGFFDDNGNATSGGNCTLKLALDVACSQRDSCADPNGNCSGTCQCLQDFYNNGGICERRRCFGESCSATSDCVSGGGLECIGGTCQCTNTTYFDGLTATCTAKKDLGSSCEPGQCLPANSVCGSVSGVCECQNGFFDDNGNATSGGNCTLKLALNVACSQPDSCADPNANCSGTCQCLQDFYNNGGTCERRRCFGESCSATSDCVSGGGLECIGGTCQCTNTSYFDGLTATCTAKKDLGSSCEPGQCLPANSVCGSVSGACECQDGFFDDNGNATSGGNCTLKLALDVACSQPDSCADPNANCSGTCQCLQDFYNNGGTCERRRCFGESCSATSDCVSGGGLECIGGTCQCTNTSYFDGLTATCTAKKDLGSSCEPGQCLPANSVCGSVSGVCECQEGFFDTNGNMAAGGDCTLKIALDIACSQQDSCADPNANCSGTCQCLQDFYNNAGTCERRRCYGESCSLTSDCVSGGALECTGSTCQCSNTTYFDVSTGNCTTRLELGSACTIDQLCADPNAVCNPLTATCRCAEGFQTNGTLCLRGCPVGGWELFENHCYLFGETELFNQASRDFCDTYDSDIYESSAVQVDSFGELTFLKNFMQARVLQPNFGYWNDLFQNTTNNVDEYWRTSGDPLFIEEWGSGEPNSQAESCTFFYKPFNYLQADVNCANPNRPTEADATFTAFALCEISLESMMIP